MRNKEVLIRPMERGEKKQLRSVMNKAFPFFMRLFYYFSKDILVAEKDGELVGGIILKKFSISKTLTGGLIAFIFTLPEVHGMGVGQKLASAGIKFLQDSGCNEIFSVVEGNNTSSSKLFSTRGFSRLSPMQQFKAYGLKTLLVWYHTFHLFDIGHFLWIRSSKNIKESKSFQWIPNIIIHVLIILLVFLRTGKSQVLTIENIAWFLLSILGLYLIRDLPMYVTAKVQNLKVKYRFWETGLLLSIFLSIILGTFLPVPGSLYPNTTKWSYRNYISKLGKMAFVSSVFLIICVWGIRIMLSMSILTAELQNHFNFTYNFGKYLLLYDVVVPFFPFGCYNGKRIWDFNKGLWLICSIPVLMLFFI